MSYNHNIQHSQRYIHIHQTDSERTGTLLVEMEEYESLVISLEEFS